MLVKEPVPPCRCVNDYKDDAGQILLYNFIINFASTGIMLLAFLTKIKNVLEQERYTRIEHSEP